ncbi:MAG TPA: hypothetical protein VGA22_04795 [Gemmatimonadales bacterium]
MEWLWLVLTGGATAYGYYQTRRFVRSRLRFVDAVKHPAVPILVGAVVGIAAMPVGALLPIVTKISGLILGAGVGLGVRSGVKDQKRLPTAW